MKGVNVKPHRVLPHQDDHVIDFLLYFVSSVGAQGIALGPYQALSITFRALVSAARENVS